MAWICSTFTFENHPFQLIDLQWKPKVFLIFIWWTLILKTWMSIIPFLSFLFYTLILVCSEIWKLLECLQVTPLVLCSSVFILSLETEFYYLNYLFMKGRTTETGPSKIVTHFHPPLSYCVHYICVYSRASLIVRGNLSIV